MKKYFWRYFFSVFAIALVILVIQTGIPFLEYGVSQQRWRVKAYEDFVDSIEETIINYDFKDSSSKGIAMALFALNDERIANIVFRDISGIPMGEEFLPKGDMASDGNASEPIPGEEKSLEPRGERTKVKLVTRIDISRGSDGSRVVTRTEVDPVDLVLPADMVHQAPFGKVIISLNGTDVFFIDLLTHTPRTYIYSKDIINAFFKGLTISIPACIIIAFLAAWFLSSRNTAYINGVRKALNDLARGKKDVSVPEQRNSELNEISLAIKELDKDLQANSKSRKAWLQSISHDLNTPTTAMKMIIDGLNDGVFPADDETFKELQKENDTLSERIDRVIEYSTLQADTNPVMSDLNTRQFMDDVLVSMGKAGSVETVVECDSIRCDAGLMSRALTELLRNAIEANGDSPEPVIWTAREKDGFYEMDVLNVGHIPSGIDTDIFEPWVRGDSSRSSGGTGLGLPIAYTILLTHKGSISLIQDSPDTVKAMVRWPK